MLRAPPTQEPIHMADTREELQELLTGLEADMPWLQKAYPDPINFIDAFAGQAGIITHNVVKAQDDAWVLSEINKILIKFGYANDLAV